MKLIHFYSEKNIEGLGQPVPIKTLLPEWYRKAESKFVSRGKEGPGLKKCVPFLDGMISGYALTVPFDIQVSTVNGKVSITWDGPDSFRDFVVHRESKQGETIPRPAGHLPDHLAFSGKWGWKLPKGYSALVIHPVNRFDLPFTVLGGIIDSDEFWANGNLPFFLKEGFEGVIPQGTPIAQIIPFKREHWEHVTNNPSMKDAINHQGFSVRQEGYSYKKKLWHRKKFD